MNQRGTRGQNDSASNIIGNLPKRLQQKIAVDCSADHERATATTQASRSPPEHLKTEEHGHQQQVPSMSILLRKSCKEPGAAREQSDLQRSSRTQTRVIPGLIRINTSESAKLQENGINPVLTTRDSGRRQVRLQRNENNFHIRKKPESPNSPVGHIQRAAHYPGWFSCLDAPNAKQLPQLHDNLLTILQHHALAENWQIFCETHAQLRDIFTQLLLNNLKFCCEQKVDTFFWKFLFYNVREYLKVQNSPQARNCTLSLIEDGIKFYIDLHKQLTAKYLCPTTSPVRGAEPQRAGPKYELIAKVAAQKLLICLGDLNRYKVGHLNASDYTEAAIYYRQAQLLIPTNGIPYNQLAVVSILAHKKFDAIYFHMRSLMSSNAIQSARESLLVLFDEIRKKYEETELKVSPVHHTVVSHSSSSKSIRKEVWIYPDGVRRLHRTNLNNINNKLALTEEKRATDLSTDDLLRHFTSLFLYVIGKLYTGIGMESIQEHQRRMLVQLKVIFKRTPLCISRSRLLKMVALNIFVLEHNMSTDSRREIRYHAYNFCNEIFGFVLRKCNRLLLEQNVQSLVELRAQTFADLKTLLQYIKIYTEWLARNVEIWEPIRSDEHTYIHCWSEFQLLFPNLKRLLALETGDKEVAVSPNTVLEEDYFLMGFTPLSSSSPSKHSRASNEPMSELEQCSLRIQKIVDFQECYEKNQKRLAMSMGSSFVAEELNPAIKQALDDIENDNDNDNGVHNGNGGAADEDANDDNSENIFMNGCNDSKSAYDMRKLTNGITSNVETNAQMTQLLKLKNELQAKSNVKKMYNDKLEEILNFVDTKVYIEVRPKYLLPDTNCFIDCLEDFERLNQEFRRYVLMVPLTVVKELDGLSKGVKLESYEKSIQKHRIHHFDDVSTRAKKALDFIKTAKNYVKCATTKGSIIQASLFALVEEEHVSNDDKILATALALSKNLSTETNKGGKCFIQTELVLITTDRNLRVKTLSRNLAVSEMSEFLQWAKDCHT